MSKQRHILVPTGSRADWGHISPVLRLIEADPRLRLSLIATNMHLLPEFGATRHEIERDGLPIEQEIYMALDGYTGVSMSKSLGVFLMSITDTIDRLRPDFLLLVGDRGEQLMAAIAASHMNVPVAHIQAGEVSGNVDDHTRHALTRFAHVHFAANEDAAERLRRSGEQEFRINQVGAPQLDELIQGEPTASDHLAARLHVSFDEPLVLLVQHSVTEQVKLAGPQIEETLAALRDLCLQTLLIYPNNDAGSAELRTKIDDFRGPWLRVERSMPRRDYAGLLRYSSAIVGNSSSAIIEAPAFGLPAVNIGRRQEGRVQGANVVNVGHDRAEIAAAVQRVIAPEFRASLNGTGSPYGDGHSSERIVRVLAETTIDERLVYKALTY